MDADWIGVMDRVGLWNVRLRLMFLSVLGRVLGLSSLGYDL